MSTAPDNPADAPPTRRWPSWLGWPVLAAAGVVAFEVTQQPILVGLTLSLKFAVQDVRTAVWLRRTDPDRRRGAAHFWLYLALAAFKSAVAGFLLGFLFAVMSMALNWGVGGPPPRRQINLVYGAVLTSLFGLGASGGASLHAVVCGCRCRRPLWLHEAVTTARARGEWPPWYGARNRIEPVVFMAVVFALFAVGLILTGVWVGVAAMAGQPVPDADRIERYVSFILLGATIGGMALQGRVTRRVAAAAPWDAWPPEPDDPDGRPADRVD